MIRPREPEPTHEFLVTLLHAMKRGLQFTYQIEEQELAAELIGDEEHRMLMFWEAAEGGTGVWERLMEEPDAVASVARQALRICHFDPGTGGDFDADSRACVVACYECLLSYSNQPEHRFLDRNLVKDLLLGLSVSTTVTVDEGRSREEQYNWLKTLVDPKSEIEATFLDFLYEGGYQLPDAAQNRPCPEVAAQPDFYYDRDPVPGVCVFIDGPPHDRPDQSERDEAVRRALEDRGYRVISVRYGRDFGEQVDQHADVFRL